MAVEVVLPMLGITVERGTITEWLKKEGDPVDKGEIIFIVEVEKATTEVESPAAGTLARILVQADVEVPVLTPVAIITEAGEELPEEYSAAPAASAAPAEAPTAPQAEAAPTALAQGPPSEDGPVKAMPAARKLAADRNIDLESIVGTGPQGVILLKDVEAAGLEPHSHLEKRMPRFPPWLASWPRKKAFPWIRSRAPAFAAALCVRTWKEPRRKLRPCRAPGCKSCP
jgi:pyruvate dehydrogenase E2 component (dihydrolipoamide acetyltransferase)